MGEQGQAQDHKQEKKPPKQQQPERAAQGPAALGQTTVDPAAAFRMVASGSPRASFSAPLGNLNTFNFYISSSSIVGVG